MNYPVHRLLDRDPRHKSHQALLPVETPQPQSAPLFEVVPVGRRTLESWRVCAEGMEQGLHLPSPPPNCWRLLVSARLWALIYCPTGSNGGKRMHLSLSLSIQSPSPQSFFEHASSRTGGLYSELGTKIFILLALPTASNRHQRGLCTAGKHKQSLDQPRKSSSTGENRHGRRPGIDARAVQPPLSTPKCCQIQGLHSPFAVKQSSTVCSQLQLLNVAAHPSVVRDGWILSA